MNTMKLTTASLIAGLGTLTLLASSGPSLAAGHPASSHARITAAEANRIALEKFPGKVQGKTPLEDEEGTWQYGVMVRSGKTLREIMVNAKTGHIDSVEVTTEAKEQIEKRADAAKAKHAHAHGGAHHAGGAAHK